MHQSIGARKYFHKGAELDNLAHGSFVDLADFCFGGNTLHHFDGFAGRYFIARCNRDGAVVLDIDLEAGRFDNAANDLAARADDFANFVRLDPQGDDAGRMAGNRGARGARSVALESSGSEARSAVKSGGRRSARGCGPDASSR
jgi:hypothetical protein